MTAEGMRRNVIVVGLMSAAALGVLSAGSCVGDGDGLTRPGDVPTSPFGEVQAIFDAIPVEDKKLFWIEGTPWRFHGYTYFSEHPEQMIEWYDSHM